jgi:hypothetical protein
VRRTAALAALIGASVACGGAEEPRFAMREVVLEGRLVHGAMPPEQLLDVKGGGLALFDADGDGDLDLYAPGGAPSWGAGGSGPGGRLWLGDGAGALRPAEDRLGLDFRERGYGVAVADVDADGREDLLVCAHGQNRLYLGTADGRFVDATEASGLGKHRRWSVAASFGDLDGDGDLDLYVANYVRFDPARPPEGMEFRGAEVFGGPMGLEAEPDEVWENLGGGTFREATEEWGFGRVAASYGLGVVIADLDGDGRQEVFVGNDSQRNFLFVRDAEGDFTERGLASGLGFDENGFGQATMGIALGDSDDDGRVDLFTTNFMADRNTLHRNRGGLLFEDRTRLAGLGQASVPFLGWSTAFVDLDQDGCEELVAFNGHVYPEATCAEMGWAHRQEPLLFTREGDHFTRVAAGPGRLAWLGRPLLSRGAAWGDLDGDGDLDAVHLELSGEVHALLNEGAQGRGLVVRLHDPEGPNPRGLGACVRVRTASGTQSRWLASGDGYASAHEAAAHFGLGEREGAVQVLVRWPDGFEQEDLAPAGARHHTVTRSR